MGNQQRINPGEDHRMSTPLPHKSREQLKLWLRDTMKRKQWSAERWAKTANLSGTTITRFLNSDDPHRVLTQRTVEKLASAADIPSPHELPQVFIAVIKTDQLLQEARSRFPVHLDLFTMPYLDQVPAPDRYKHCRLVQLDNGRFAICEQAEIGKLPPGSRLVVLRDCTTPHASTAGYFFDPPMLVPADPCSVKTHWVSSLPLAGPNHQILGRMRGEYIDYDD